MHDEATAVLPGPRQSDRPGDVLSPSLPPRGQHVLHTESLGQVVTKIPSETVTKIPIAALVRAESPRLGGEDRAHVQRLLEVDDAWPPILVHRATMQIIDGFHRVSAAVQLGLDEIDAIFLDEPWESAFLVAVQANVTHGLPLSLADRRAAAEKIVRTHSELSDRAVGAITGLSAKTIRDVRFSSPQAPIRDRRVGRDGRVRPLNAAVGRQLAVEYLSSHPEASLREIAAAVGISTGTARDVRTRLRRGDDPVPTPAVEKRDAHRHLGISHPRPAPTSVGYPADVNPILATLSKDPALRMSNAGRELLRWLQHHAVNSIDSVKVVENVPDHCVEHLVQLASRCSANWARIAHDLAQSSQQRHYRNAELADDAPGGRQERCS